MFEKYTAYQPMQTTTTTWSGWQIVNPKCYGCFHCVMRGAVALCCYVSRTFKRGPQGDECLSYRGREMGGDAE